MLFRYLELDRTNHYDIFKHTSLWEITITWLSNHKKINSAPEIKRPSVLQHPEIYYSKHTGVKDTYDEMVSHMVNLLFHAVAIPLHDKDANAKADDEPFTDVFELNWEI